MTDLTVGPDYNSDHETLADAAGRPITADYLEQLSGEADAGYDLTHARQLDPDELAAMRTRGRPTPNTPAGQSRAVSVRMNSELLHELRVAGPPVTSPSPRSSAKQPPNGSTATPARAKRRVSARSARARVVSDRAGSRRTVSG